MGLRVENLDKKNEIQLSFFTDEDDKKQEKVDKVVDQLKQKYGYGSITRAGNLHSSEIVKLKDL